MRHSLKSQIMHRFFSNFLLRLNLLYQLAIGTKDQSRSFIFQHLIPFPKNVHSRIMAKCMGTDATVARSPTSLPQHVDALKRGFRQLGDRWWQKQNEKMLFLVVKISPLLLNIRLFHSLSSKSTSPNPMYSPFSFFSSSSPSSTSFHGFYKIRQSPPFFLSFLPAGCLLLICLTRSKKISLTLTLSLAEDSRKEQLNCLERLCP